MTNFLLGQQRGCTKYLWFMCLWNSRACDVHWEKKVWPPRTDMTVNEASIIYELVPRDKIIIHPLHITLGLMKQFVKTLPDDGCCFNYICNFFQE